MKKTLFFIAAGIFAGLLFLVISCSKEEPNSKAQNQPAQTAYEQQVTKAIKDFKQKVVYYRENPVYKNGETLSADSALWLLEATINYSHAFPNEYYTEMQSDDLTLVVPKNENGEVEMQVLTQKYDEMIAAVTTVYENSTFEDKGLVLVDLSVIAQDENEIVINVQTITGEGGSDPNPPILEGPFEEGDDWWYGEDEGMCDQPVYSSDAAQQLNSEMNNYIANQNSGVYFIHQTQVTKTGGGLDIRRNGDPNPPNNVYDYYMYSSSTEYGTITDEILCLEWQEMNAYYNFLKYLLFDLIPDEEMPTGYTIETIVEMEGIFEQTPNDYFHYFHEATFKYGLPIGYGEGEGPEEL